MHVQAFDFVEAQARDLLPGCHVLEVGSHDVNGGIRSLFGRAASYHGIDVTAGPGVDEVADGATWRPGEALPSRFDVVVCTEVLEHAPRWREVMSNAWSLLAPGGRLVVTCATEGRAPHSAVDGMEVRPGEWYRNLPASEVLDLLLGWRPASFRLAVAPERGDLYLRADRGYAMS